MDKDWINYQNIFYGSIQLKLKSGFLGISSAHGPTSLFVMYLKQRNVKLCKILTHKRALVSTWE